MKRLIAHLIAWDNLLVMRQLVRTAEHPYRSLAWRILGLWVSGWTFAIATGLLTGAIHITIT